MVWSIECTEHLYDKARFFQRAAAWLRPGGRMAICAWLAGEALEDQRQVRQVYDVCEGFFCPSLGTCSDYRQWMTDAGLTVERDYDWTARVAQTWEICQRRVRRSGVRWLAGLIDRDTAMFLDRFDTILEAYRSGAMRYGCFIAHKPIGADTARPPRIARMLPWAGSWELPSDWRRTPCSASRSGISSGFSRTGPRRAPAALPWDGLLAFQFGAIHSLVLWPPARRRLAAWFPAELYGCIFCTVTCLSLLLTFACWRASPVVFWSLAGWPRAVIQAAFVASWIALIYSLSLTGLGYQTGWTPFVHWLRGRPAPRREFTPRGAYHFFRHPVYLSFLGLVWFTPRMTLDHAVLTGIWTVYILVGSYLKDRRLTYYLGDAYRAYQARVPGYPLVPFGPLGKVDLQAAESQFRAVTLRAAGSVQFCRPRSPERPTVTA